MTTVMIPSGASTAVTGEPEGRRRPAARWAGSTSQRRSTMQTGSCPQSESSGDPPGGRADSRPGWQESRRLIRHALTGSGPPAAPASRPRSSSPCFAVSRCRAAVPDPRLHRPHMGHPAAPHPGFVRKQNRHSHRAGSHMDEQPSDSPDPAGRPEETSPRSRTNLNASGRPRGYLRICECVGSAVLRSTAARIGSGDSGDSLRIVRRSVNPRHWLGGGGTFRGSFDCVENGADAVAHCSLRIPAVRRPRHRRRPGAR